MTEETMQNAFLEWKRKKYFPADKCGLKGCQRAAEGYISDIKPTKGGNPNGRLWYGPACSKCPPKQKPGTTVRPMTFAELAHQRNGASDLAFVLDIEVGEVLKRLEAANIDERGQRVGGQPQLPHTNPQAPPQAPPMDMTAQPQAPPQAQPQAPAAAVPQMQQQTVAAAEGVIVPVDTLKASYDESEGLLVALGSFHVTNQQQMNAAGEFLKEVKSKWRAIDQLRKDLGEPLRGKLQEIQNYFKPALDSLAKAEGVLKLKISEGNTRAQQAQQAALEAAQQAHAQGNVQATAAASQAAAQADVAMPQGVHQSSRIKFEIVDPSQLPGNFWSPDVAKIQAAINAGHRQIPGVRIWEDQGVVSRAS